jgi:uroporphyrinogen decarboxylase
MVTTIFNAWATLRGMIQLAKETPGDPADASNRWIRSAWRRDRQTVETALRIIGINLAKCAARCLDAGADGIFLSVRDDWVEGKDDEGPASLLSFDQLVRPLDLMILRAADSAPFNILHVCGKSLNLRRFNDYPVHALNWADRSAGPAIADVKDWLRPAICAGVNHEKTLLNGSPADVSRELTEAVQQAGDRPIIIAPGCTFDPARVPRENLRAIRPLAV